MSYWTDYAETHILNTFRGTTAVAPTTMYLGLFLSNPGEVGGGTELSYAGYERRPIAFTVPTESSLGVTMTNSSDITFPRCNQTAGNVTYIGIFDSQVSGNMWAYNKIEGEPLIVDADVTPLFKAETIIFESRGNFSKIMKTRMLNLMRGVNLDGFTPYFAPYNGNPESGGAELSGLGYARTLLSYSAPQEQVSGQMMISNGNVTSSIPGETWGTWSFTAIMDAVASGDCVAYIEANTPQIVGKNRVFDIATGDLPILLN